MRRHKPTTPVLRFTPYAWAKLICFRDAGPTEIGGFGITRLASDDLLLVEDFVTVPQVDSAVTVSFDDVAVADFFDRQVDMGRKPEQFGRIWVHTHPGQSALPSSTDEETFERVFGCCDWAIMFILAKYGETYCRLRFNTGPGGQFLLNTAVEYHHPFAGADQAAWKAEYDRNIIVQQDIFGLELERFNQRGRPRHEVIDDRMMLDDMERERLEEAEDLLDYGIEVYQ